VPIDLGYIFHNMFNVLLEQLFDLLSNPSVVVLSSLDGNLQLIFVEVYLSLARTNSSIFNYHLVQLTLGGVFEVLE